MPSALLSKLSCDYGNLSGVPSHFSNYGPFMKLVAMDPLWDIPKTEAVTLVKKWFTNMGSLYPFLREEKLIDTVDGVYAVIGPISGGAPIPRRELATEALLNDETNKLKIVLAVSKTMENGGRNDQAQRLFQSTTEAVESLIWNPSGISGIQLLVLTVSSSVTSPDWPLISSVGHLPLSTRRRSTHWEDDWACSKTLFGDRTTSTHNYKESVWES